ncbi:hypothetical protein ACN9MB_09005 [Dyella kyungheensis]|uniref:hypothetical protein n=1 Tax=Dyella kyungheensis TaxID=1242174 RepID=UPI003CEE9088
MTICTGINPSDIPCADLKLLEQSLVLRINKDQVMLAEVREELSSRVKSVELSSTEE